ncbi:hypothetical protein PINS_up004948 [Pythium insidiosum]|nr:hypothetical protein PINS_up004948 [Pythium insidiosum]
MSQAASQRLINVGVSTRKLSAASLGSTRQLRDVPAAQASPVRLALVDASTRDRFLEACRAGDADAMQTALSKLQQQHPECTAHITRGAVAVPAEQRPFYNVLGAGLAAAASHNHTSLVELLMTGAYAECVVHGICRDDALFPPFMVPQGIPSFPVKRCVQSMRFVAFAALACVDRVATQGFQCLLEMEVLLPFEAEWCLELAMRRAVAQFDSTDAMAEGAPFQTIIIHVLRRFEALVDTVRDFHLVFERDVQAQTTDAAIERLDRAHALQSVVLYELVTNR